MTRRKRYLKGARVMLIAACLAVGLSSCNSSGENGIRSDADNSSNTSGRSATPAPTSPNASPSPPASSPARTKTPEQLMNSGEGLTNSKVETAVNQLLGEFRLGGSVSVAGIRLLPQQNATVADLQFNRFEYATSFEGKILKAKNFTPKRKPNDQTRLPTTDEMFPSRKAAYSKDGTAVLAHYADGRWVLKEIHWGGDTGVKGSVVIR